MDTQTWREGVPNLQPPYLAFLALVPLFKCKILSIVVQFPPGLILPPTRLELLPPVPLPPPIFPGSDLRILPRFIEQQVTHRSLQNNTTMYLIHFLEFLLKFFVFIHVSRPTKATRINNCLTNGF